MSTGDPVHFESLSNSGAIAVEASVFRMSSTSLLTLGSKDILTVESISIAMLAAGVVKVYFSDRVLSGDSPAAGELVAVVHGQTIPTTHIIRISPGMTGKSGATLRVIHDIASTIDVMGTGYISKA